MLHKFCKLWPSIRVVLEKNDFKGIPQAFGKMIHEKEIFTEMFP